MAFCTHVLTKLKKFDDLANRIQAKIKSGVDLLGQPFRPSKSTTKRPRRAVTSCKKKNATTQRHSLLYWKSMISFYKLKNWQSGKVESNGLGEQMRQEIWQRKKGTKQMAPRMTTQFFCFWFKKRKVLCLKRNIEDLSTKTTLTGGSPMQKV